MGRGLREREEGRGIRGEQRRGDREESAEVWMGAEVRDDPECDLNQRVGIGSLILEICRRLEDRTRETAWRGPTGVWVRLYVISGRS